MALLSPAMPSMASMPWPGTSVLENRPRPWRSGSVWTPNRKASSSISSDATRTCLCGAQQKCQASPRKSSSTPNIKPGSRPIKQGLRRFNQEKHRAMDEELSRLLATGFVKEVQHPDWIANPVLVPKKNRRWWMCVDYTSLNKGMLEGSLPPPLNRSGHRPHCRVRTPKFLGCLLELPLDTPHQGRLACHHVHHSIRMLLLRENVVQTKECGGHLPVVYAILFQRANRAQPDGLCSQHHRKDLVE
jgi:hypothetical protein